MKRRRYTLEQAARKLREGEKRLNAGEELGSVLRQLEITESTWNRKLTIQLDQRSGPRHRSSTPILEAPIVSARAGCSLQSEEPSTNR